MSIYDVAIIGTGTMGSAAAYHLAKRGARVIGFEQFQIVHDQGSHSGSTRIIRHAYFESPDYVPLILRADELWLDLARQTGRTVLVRTGGIDMGAADSTLVQGALEACRAHGLAYEHLTATDMMTRWPQFVVPREWEVCFDPQAGFLLVDDCIRGHIELATKQGAEIHDQENVLSWSHTNGHFEIDTSRGPYEAGRLIVCAGSWTSAILAELHLPLQVKRKTLTWLKPDRAEDFSVERFPIFLAEVPEGVMYGFPLFHHNGVKVANHNMDGPPIIPENADRAFHPSDVADVQEFVRSHLPGLTTEIVDGKVCLYTITPDADFIVDFHPHNRDLLVAAGFSGHGFKFGSVIGEALADLCLKGQTQHPISRFRIDRFVP
jgi:monomeric sarcosine oxidase